MAWIGVDVSKAKLDVAWLREREPPKVKTRVFPNTQTGIKSALSWLAKQTQEPIENLRILMEATGVYHEALAYEAHAAGARVYVTNPKKAKHFAESFGRRSKTDRKDSVMLARFLASRSHHVWQPEPEEIRYLRALLARLGALEKDIQREENRYEKARIQNAAEDVLTSIQNMTTALTRERDRLRQEINDHIDRNDHLKQDRTLLETIPGIGRILSAELLAVLRCRDFTSAGQSAAFVGLVPVMHESGQSVEKRPRLSKAGAARLRAKLYMGAIVALQHNSMIQKQYERLRSRGKSKMSALGAAMRKLLQIAYGVLKHQTGYNPQAASL